MPAARPPGAAAARRSGSRVGRAAGALVVAVGLVACGSSPPPAATNAGGPSSAGDGTVVVFHAASLQAPFAVLAERYEAAHPGTTVQLDPGGSDTLAAQVAAGAPADVFAAASDTTMRVVERAGATAAPPRVLARNTLEIATAPGNPEGIGGLADLVRPGVTLDLCAPTVPCGEAARKAFTTAGLVPQPVSEEQSVSGVVTKVRLGEVDAGLVYRTDVLAAGGAVTGVPFPEAAQAVVDYPVAALGGGSNPAGGSDFVAFVLGPEGGQVLQDAGFLRPEPG